MKGWLPHALQVVQSDYSKLESTTKAQESSAKKDFADLKSEMAILKADQLRFAHALTLLENALKPTACVNGEPSSEVKVTLLHVVAWHQVQQEKDLEHKKLQKGEKEMGPWDHGPERLYSAQRC